MNRVKQKNVLKSTKRRIPTPGVYQATVTAVVSPAGYAPDNAIEVHYVLTEPKSGEQIPYKERFYIVEPMSERTVVFEAHLDEIGVEAYEDYVGCELILTLMKEVKRGRSFVNVVERHLLTEHENEWELGKNVC